ncbi:hypothetical protein [Rhodopirellula sp. MGV]|uniref:hypothetical protein n=1 Tax=Rhodopirellula sp. MGV TaxID=2023130 RepID=UPI000B9662E2|nr:hypothetical protein [Rhodopirellula sp. MGV]OYP38535.1 hypothetical protein CGZ80_01980 [Rhodopirellula sp. MGV]PNY34818.1 hypothetical protein C2E31_21465 [Rhodopirellula baltica]
MFGYKRRKKTETVQWPHLQALLEDDDQRAAIDRLFPQPRRESFLTALRRIAPQQANDLVSLGRQVQHGAQLAEYPTLAIAGMLNSGKTSLVASLLSPSGRARTLRGIANRHGTHRFVLWMPQRWREEPELWSLLLEDFGNAVGNAPELLHDDPELAHEQYNNRSGGVDALGVPLVATDPALDELGIGLLDCPDIVSDEVFGVGSPQRRRELLGKASTFCSAFMIVSTPAMARDRTLGEILQTVSDLMPGIPRLLAVNKIRPGQEPEDILESFAPQTDKFGVERIYGAYDFEIPKSDPYIPKKVVDGDQVVTVEQNVDDPVPVFYSIDARAEHNPPAEIDASRLLVNLSSELDCPESFERFLRGRTAALRRSVWDVSLNQLQQDCEQSVRLSERARQTILESTISLFTKPSGQGGTEIRMHQSKHIVQQLADAFCLAAPWYARLGVRINTFIQKKAKAATDLMTQYAPTALAESYAESFKEKFKAKKVGHLIAPDDLDTTLRRFGAPLTLRHWFGDENDPIDAALWNTTLEDTLQAFAINDRVQFDGDQLQKVAEEMWLHVPKHKKLAFGLTPLAALLATFGSILMLPFDFGSSIIANASIVELFAAAGLTAFSAYWAGGKNAQILTAQAALEQMSMFYVLLCQHLGVAPGDPMPTIKLGPQSYRLPVPNVNKASVHETTPKLSVYRTNEVFLKELNSLMPPTAS